MKPKSHIVATISVDKSLPILPNVGQPSEVETVSNANEKVNRDKEWTESRILFKDLHQHYLKLSKSRLTSKIICFIKLIYKLNLKHLIH